MSVNSKRKKRGRITATVLVLAICFGLGYVGVYFLSGHTVQEATGPQLVSTRYSYGGITYNMLFYSGSREESANDISALTQGGKRPLANPMTVLESPVLENGTGVDLFIVPATTGPLLLHNLCSDKPGLTALYTVKMQQSSSPAVVCSFAPPGKFQGEYLFQFAQGKITYDGFVQLTYNYNQVMNTQQSAKKFASSAGLDRYQDEIKRIIASIVAS